MSAWLLDTDHIGLIERNDPVIRSHLTRRPATSIAVSVVTMEESLRGRLAVLSQRLTSPQRVQAYANLLTTVRLYGTFTVLPFDSACEVQFQQLIGLRLRVGTQDLKIAATALANGFTLVTRNRSDFQRVPGLVLEDWSVP
jgi:tRNA(fMet)-specific endonuclease VapC